jgi:chloride channel protein, CIC family
MVRPGPGCLLLLVPHVVPNPISLAIVGMAAFFAAVVRAPMTGIILTIEMTSSFTMLLRC